MENKALHLEIENLKGCNSHWALIILPIQIPVAGLCFSDFKIISSVYSKIALTTGDLCKAPTSFIPPPKCLQCVPLAWSTKSSQVLLWSLVIENNMLKGDSLLEHCKCTLPDHVLYVHFRQWKSLLLAAVCLLWHGSCWESSLMPWKWDESHGGEDRLILEVLSQRLVSRAF